MRKIFLLLEKLDPRALLIAKAGLAAAALLLFCECLLLGFGAPVSVDTYYINQYARAIQQVAGDCALLAVTGAVFAQFASRRSK